MCSLAFSLAAFACDPKGPESEARDRLATDLRDSLGSAADPNVAFITNGAEKDSHLYVMFDTTAFANVSDSIFELRARDLARFAMRHYEKASRLDSVTVAARESVRPDVWRVHHTRTFTSAQVKNPR
jgi:hypothetical protein